MRYWLMKSEPECFGLSHLEALPGATTCWDGVRNYQARNMMRDEMALGDRVLLYHSNCKPPGVVGVMEVVREAYPDHSAFDPEDPHYDPKSDPDQPRWFMVDVRLERPLGRLISLDELRADPALEGLQLLRRGNRLSVMPVSSEHYDAILAKE